MSSSPAISNRDAERLAPVESLNAPPLAPPHQVQTWLSRDEAALIDVREPLEFAREHIEGAALLPLSRFDPARLGDRSDRIIVLHCAGGQRSQQAAHKARQAGLEVVELEGGLAGWKKAALPTIVNPRSPIPVMRQVQIATGSLVALGTVLGWLLSPWFLILSGLVGCGLVFAGLSGWCGMAMFLARMPWNRVEVAILGEK